MMTLLAQSTKETSSWVDSLIVQLNQMVDEFTPYVFALVLTLSFILLMMTFRSIVIPIKAVLMNLLSVGVAYGLLVLVFQKGIGNEIFGFQQTDIIEAWIPLFLFFPKINGSPCFKFSICSSRTGRS